jgi:hypothetical protein
VRRRGSHFLDNRLTDGGEVVSLTRPPPRLIKKSNDPIWNRTRHLPAYSIVPQSTTLPRAPIDSIKGIFCWMLRNYSEAVAEIEHCIYQTDVYVMV